METQLVLSAAHLLQAYPFSLLEDSVADALNSSSTPTASVAHSRRSSSAADGHWHQGAPTAREQQQQQANSSSKQRLHSTFSSSSSGWLRSFFAPTEAQSTAGYQQQQQEQGPWLGPQAQMGSTEEVATLKEVEGAAGSSSSVSGLGTVAAAAAAARLPSGNAHEQLVGLDEHGQPLTGWCNRVRHQHSGQHST